MSYRISEVSERTGFSASALRFYEAEGIVPEPARTSSGYRIYDDRAVDRLVLVSRAKELGCTLEEIRDLVEAWDADDCGPVKHHLRGFVTTKIADVQRHISEQVALEAQLQRAAAVLASAPLDGPCDDTCGCVSADGEVPIACSLGTADVGQRVDDWSEVLRGVVRREPMAGGVRLVFDGVGRLTAVSELAAAEHECCPFFSFTVTVDGRGLGLEVRAPADGQDILTAVFGTAA